MTLEECYSKLGGDYKELMLQLGSEKIAEKFLLKFPSEPSMQDLRAAVEEGDIEASFQSAHRLKGVSANIALKELNLAVASLTDQLRPRKAVADPNLMGKVNENYNLVIQTINEYIHEKENCC